MTVIEDVVKRAEAAIADWQSKHDAISDPPAVTLAWLTAESKVGGRLKQIWQEKRVEADGWDWPEDFDPFDGVVICRDKLADSYKVGATHAGEKPVEIDLAAEIDLGIIDLERRRSAAKAVAEKG